MSSQDTKTPPVRRRHSNTPPSSRSSNSRPTEGAGPVSDHFSGPRAIAGPAGDITDVYAFPSPERPGHLVLVMNVLPLATADSAFSDAIDCRFRLRPVSIGGTGPAAAFPFASADQELMITCRF